MGRERPRPFKSLIGVGEGGEIGVQAQEEGTDLALWQDSVLKKMTYGRGKKLFFPQGFLIKSINTCFGQ